MKFVFKIIIVVMMLIIDYAILITQRIALSYLYPMQLEDSSFALPMINFIESDIFFIFALILTFIIIIKMFINKKETI